LGSFDFSKGGDNGSGNCSGNVIPFMDTSNEFLDISSFNVSSETVKEISDFVKDFWPKGERKGITTEF
jgi:hypothetical protein